MRTVMCCEAADPPPSTRWCATDWRYVWLFVLGGALAWSALAAEGLTVERVRIDTLWRGRGTPSDAAYVIERKDGIYYRTATQGVRELVQDFESRAKDPAYSAEPIRVPVSAIEELVSAISAPPVREPSLESLGIDGEWLRNHAESSYQTFAERSQAHPRWRELFIATFQDTGFAANAVPRVFGRGIRISPSGRWLPPPPRLPDDSPWVAVDLRFTNGQVWKVSSDQQYPLMLPWQLLSEEGPKSTFNGRVPMAVLKLLPDGVLNSQRLTTESFLRQYIRRAVVPHVEEEWMKFLRDEPSSPLAFLHGSYQILKAAISAQPAYNRAPDEPRYRSFSGWVRLRRADDPRAPEIDADGLRFSANEVANPVDVLSRIHQYDLLFQEVPWLREAAQTDFDLGATIHVRNPTPSYFPMREFPVMPPVSITEPEMVMLVKDLIALRKESLLEGIERSREQVVLLTTRDRTWWLILPDKRVVLWKFIEGANLIRWTPEQIPYSRCSPPEHKNLRCVGAVIHPNGELVP
ncbi:MAG: hypothetical protein KIT83_16980 [Bryobacterales bacterium]|nr:hypothetical protein [Bryobacterales bacterium]